jgi:CBS domain-containing protein
MLARDIMTGSVHTATPGEKVKAIAQLMLDKRISAVPVVDGGAVVGIVSEGDLMRRPETGTEPRHSWWLGLFASGEEIAGEYVKSHGLTAADVMTRNVVMVSPDMPVAEVAELLERRHIKRVPVVHNGTLVGIISRANIIRGLATHKEKISALLRNFAAKAKAGEAADDSAIRKDVVKKLRDSGLDNEAMVNPIVADGVVHLWGAAGSETERDAIRLAAESAHGVTSVVCHIGVLPAQVRAVYWAE